MGEQVFVPQELQQVSALEQRRADGFANPEQDGSLVHTESLRTAAQHAKNNVLGDGQRKKAGV